MRVLVLGATGLLGGRIAEYLTCNGHEVVCGIKDPQKEAFLKSLPVEISYIDLEKLLEISGFPGGINAIVYAAGMNSSESAIYPERAMNIRGSSTRDLIGLAVKNKVRKFIYISSAHIYKNPLLGAINESSPLQNEDVYALSHRAGEKVVIDNANLGLIEGLVLRVSNSFGYPVDKHVNCWDLLVNNICKQVVESGEIFLKSDGSQFRNFVPIHDVCRVIDYFLSCMPNFGDGRINPVVNVGSKRALTLLDMATIVQSRFNFLNNIVPKINLRNHTVLSDFPETTNFLDYKTDLLRDSGFVIEENFHKEIDSLIQFCYKNF
jgi:UDP-glucose 4-epimerase